MGRTYDTIDEKMAAWIGAQPMFFVATAPNDPAGHINISPKGARDTFRLLGPTRYAWLDLVGSGAETIAHLRESGRIVVMFCAFDGPPKVIRLHGTGRVVQAHEPEFADLVAAFAPNAEILRILRSVIVVEVSRIADSCGFVVPRMALVEERQQLFAWGDTKERTLGDGWKAKYIATNNQASIDGLAALASADGATDITERETRALSSDGKAL